MTLAQVTTALRARFDDHARNDLRMDPRTDRMTRAAMALVQAALEGHGPDWEAQLFECVGALRKAAR